MTLYMTEIVVGDLAASLAWYRDRLGLRVERIDEPNGFALLRANDGGRLALKVGVPATGGVKLHFHVADLSAELKRMQIEPDGLKTSDEGYRRAVLNDPDGYEVVLFEWVAASRSGSGAATKARP